MRNCKSKQLCLCTTYNDLFAPWLKRVLDSYKWFCDNNSCELMAFDNGSEDNFCKLAWSKFTAITTCFEKGFEWIFWCDSDSLYIGGPPILELFGKGPDIQHTEDTHGLCSSHGLWRNTSYTRALLPALQLLGNRKKDVGTGKCEQGAFRAVEDIFSLPSGLFPIKIVQHRKWLEADKHIQFLHFGGISNDIRRVLINGLEIKRSGHDHSVLKPYENVNIPD